MSLEPIFTPATTRATTPAVDAVRGFVFSSGRRWFQEHGLMDRYVELLPAPVKDRAFTITALEWLPLEVAMSCYDACDALDLTASDQREIGRVVSSANNGPLIETIARLAGGLGVSPWVALKDLHKVWLRSNRGGAVAVYKATERSARIEMWRVPMAASSFFCTSMCGAVEGGIRLFRKSATVSEVREERTADGLTLTATW
jgi:hypothetical protein